MNKINRINYIVQENPKGVSETLLAEGMKPSTDLNLLTQQTKQWIQKEGKTAIVKLLKVHPEKDAILSANQTAFDNFSGCGCKSSFDGSSCGCKSSFDGSACPCSAKSSYSAEDKRELGRMDEKELQLHYKELKRLLKQFPEDEELRQEIELVWDYIGSKPKSESKHSRKKEQIHRSKNITDPKTVFSVNSKDLAVGSFIFGIALIISQIR